MTASADARLAARADGAPSLRPREGAVNDTAPIRVLLVDDHAVVRMGLKVFFDLQDDIEVVGEASDGS